MAIIKYSGRGDTGSISNDGGKTWNSLGGSGNSPSGGNGGNQGNTGSSGNKGSTTVNSAGTTWNNYNGATGKQYSVAGSNGTIRVTQKDGSTRTVLPTDADYSVTQKAMQADLQGNGIQYTPTRTFNNGNGTYTVKDYVTGNNNLKYALEQAAKANNGGYWKANTGTHTGNTGKMYTIGDDDSIKITRLDGTTAYVRPNDKNYEATVQAMNADGVKSGELVNYNNAGLSVDDYVKSLYNRIGSQRGDGSVVSLSDINKELDRLGLSDYNSRNALLTAGGKLLPGNEFLKYKDDAGLTTNSPDSRWVSYGGQDYLMGGDSANFAQYVNGKTGNLDNLSFLFGNMQNNPYAQQDREFMQAYQNAQNQFNAAGGIGAGNGTNYSPTGYQNVDSVIQYVNSLNNYNAAAGNGGAGNTTNLLDMLQSYLNSGLDANKDFIQQQRTQAEQAASQQASDAYVNSRRAQNSLREQLSALGLGTSGALQSGQVGLQGDYSTNLNTINSNLDSMLSNLSQQELQVLSDYYNNMANYAYQVTNDEANRALQQAQLALQQQQAAYDQQYQQQQLAMQQAQWEWQKQQAEREYENTLSQQDYNKKLQQAGYYQDMYNSGTLGDEGLYNALAGLGLVNGGYFSNGSYTQGATTAQLERQLAQAQLQNQYLANQKLQSSLKKSKSGGGNNTQIDPFGDDGGAKKSLTAQDMQRLALGVATKFWGLS